jgi:YHS domain-containing protein
MKMRLLSLTAIVLALFAIHSIRAADEKAPALKCPVSGKAASTDHAKDYDGGKVYFCCDNCPEEFAKDTAKYAAKAHHQMVQTGQLVEAKCPLTGRPLNPAMTVEIDGVKVAFCCGNCKKKIEAMAADDQKEAVFKDVSKGYKLADKK